MSFYTIKEPNKSSPVVVNVPHAGTKIPATVRDTIVAGTEDMHRDVDWAVDALYGDAPDYGATLMYTDVSRFVIDLNRGRNEISDEAVDFELPGRTKGIYGRRGLLWLETTFGVTVVERPLTRAELDARMAFYGPYHVALRALLDARAKEFGNAVLIDGHSMPSVGRAGHPDEGAKRADVVLGDVDGTSCPPVLTECVEAAFASAGYSVVRNVPYKGGFNTKFYGHLECGFHALQIELSRRIYMDEDNVELIPEKAHRLRAVLMGIVEGIVDLNL